jgi:hypothetical protein
MLSVAYRASDTRRTAPKAIDLEETPIPQTA